MERPTAWSRLVTTMLWLATLTFSSLIGCTEPQPTLLPPAPDLDRVDLLSNEEGKLIHEQWFTHTVGKHKLGHRRYREFAVGPEANHLLRIAIDELAIPRFGSVTNQVLRMATLSDAVSDQVEQLEYSVSGDHQAKRTAGLVIQDRLHLSGAATSGSTAQQTWNKENKAFFAIEQAFQQSPLLPDQERIVLSWEALADRESQMRLRALGHEKTRVGNQMEHLLRVEARPLNSKEDEPPTSIYWVDETGRPRKKYRRFLNQTTFACSKETALSPNDHPQFDLAVTNSFAIELPPSLNKRTDFAQFQVTTPGQDAANIFPSNSYQRVQRTAADCVLITVGMPSLSSHADALRDDANIASLPPALPQSKTSMPRSQDVEANHWINSSDRHIQKFSHWPEKLTTVDEICKRSTAAVHAHMQQSILDESLLTASRAFQARAGDCTEHAMLLAAVLRTQSIPARVVTGLILDANQSRLQFHMWTEAWDGLKWLPLDATISEPHPNALRIKLSDSNLAEDTDWAIVAPVLLLGKNTGIKFLQPNPHD